MKIVISDARDLGKQNVFRAIFQTQNSMFSLGETWFSEVPNSVFQNVQKCLNYQCSGTPDFQYSGNWM